MARLSRLALNLSPTLESTVKSFTQIAGPNSKRHRKMVAMKLDENSGLATTSSFAHAVRVRNWELGSVAFEAPTIPGSRSEVFGRALNYPRKHDY